MGRVITQWQAVHAAAQGVKNEQRMIACQDVIDSRVRPNGVLCVLADGAGSASQARAGAEATVQALCEFLANQTSSWIKTAALECVQADIMHTVMNILTKLAHKMNHQINDFASTVLWVLIEDSMALIGHLGDGVIVGLTPTQQTAYFSADEEKEHANQTTFTTSKNAIEHLRIKRIDVQAIQTFALMSDGSAHTLVKVKEQQVAPAVAKMASWLDHNLRTDVQTAISTQLCQNIRKKCFDDCALGIIHQSTLTITSTLDPTDPRVMEFFRVTPVKSTVSGTRTRLSIIQNLPEDDALSSKTIAQIASATDCSQELVRRYIRQLRPRLKTGSTDQ